MIVKLFSVCGEGCVGPCNVFLKIMGNLASDKVRGELVTVSRLFA